MGDAKTWGLILGGPFGYSIGAQMDATDQQKQAQSEAKAAAEKQAKAQEEATNAANQKKPDVSAIMAAAQNASKGGGSTMLTGPQGIDPSAMSLGKTSLLGG